MYLVYSNLTLSFLVIYLILVCFTDLLSLMKKQNMIQILYPR